MDIVEMKSVCLRISNFLRIIVPENWLSLFPKTFFSLLVTVVGSSQVYRGIPADTSFNPGSELRKLAGSYPGISLAETGDTSSLTISRNLVYTSSGSRNLHLDLFMGNEKSSRRLPLVVFVHGGGWRSGDLSMDHPMAAEMARRGYAAACVEYRLSGEALYPAGIVDVKTALRWLRINSRKFSLDRNRFAIAGSSAGGKWQP
jgi:pectinesterase